MSIIIIGSNHTNTAKYYKQLGISESELVTTINHGYEVGHTSIQDIPEHSVLEVVLKNADEVYWAHSDASEFSDSDSYYDFLNWLKDYNLLHHNVANFASIKFDPYNWTTNIELDSDHAVFLGCSFTAGAGIRKNPEDRYAFLVSKYFNKRLLNLAVSGGSNSLIFDQFTRLNFYPEQLVVVQFTWPERIHYCNQDKQLLKLRFHDIDDKRLKRSMVEIYNKDFLFYEFLCKLRAMIKIARMQKLKLVFWLADYKGEQVYSKLDQTYFYDMPEFVPASWMAEYFVDFAEDNSHPGIESNKNIANTLIKYIETVYERRH